MTTVLHDFRGWPGGPLHLAIGVFDGVHVGHRALIQRIAEQARADGGTAIATTFDPLPVDVLAPASPPSTLTDIDERVALLGAAGADAVAVLHFTREMSLLEPTEFVRRVVDAGDVRSIVVGADFRFGHDRAGDVRLLGSLEGTHGYAFEIAAAVALDGRVVSSTRVRNALLAGHVEEAARLLERPYVISATIEAGDPHGRGLGFPAIALRTPPRRLLPRDGIYAIWVAADDRRLAAAASLGVRPTPSGEERRLDAFLLDGATDLHGTRVRAEFVKRLRDELRFETAAELASQIRTDVDETRAALRSGPHGV